MSVVHHVANDTGRAIAQTFTVRYPGRVRTLTPTNCEADDVLPSPHELAQLVFTAATQGDLVPHLRRHWAVR